MFESLTLALAILASIISKRADFQLDQQASTPELHDTLLLIAELCIICSLRFSKSADLEVMVAMFIMQSGASVIIKSRIFSLRVGKGFTQCSREWSCRVSQTAESAEFVEFE